MLLPQISAVQKGIFSLLFRSLAAPLKGLKRPQPRAVNKVSIAQLHGYIVTLSPNPSPKHFFFLIASYLTHKILKTIYFLLKQGAQ